MAADWIECHLGDVVTLKRGYDLSTAQRNAGGVPVVSSSGISGHHDEAKVRGPGVVTGRYGTLGEVFYIRGDYWPLNTTLYVQDFKGNDPLFVSYFLRTLNFASQNVAGAVPGVNRNYLHMLQVRVPPLPIQHKIADILSAYDDLIENNSRRIQILEEMAQTIYREWFVNFRFPGHEKVELVESELGLIPEKWEVVTLGDITTLHRGKSYRSQDLAKLGGLPFLNLKCVERGGGFRLDGIKRYSGDFKNSQTARPGDVVVAVTDMTQERRLVAHAARVPLIDHSFAVMSMDLVRVEPQEKIAAGYLHGLLRFSDFSDTIKQHANGVNVLHLNPKQIQEFNFVLPSRTLRDKYALVSDDLYRQCDVLQRENANLRQTRDLLLPRLVSGEVAIRETNQILNNFNSSSTQSKGTQE